jgi:hypothetical protein
MWKGNKMAGNGRTKIIFSNKFETTGSFYLGHCSSYSEIYFLDSIRFRLIFELIGLLNDIVKDFSCEFVVSLNVDSKPPPEGDLRLSTVLEKDASIQLDDMLPCDMVPYSYASKFKKVIIPFCVGSGFRPERSF